MDSPHEICILFIYEKATGGTLDSHSCKLKERRTHCSSGILCANLMARSVM
jgi:hypothetical protein